MVDLFRNQKWDLVSHRGLYYVISAVMLLVGLVALFRPGGGLNLGIDFKGGGLVTYRVSGHFPTEKDPVIIGEIRDKLKAAGIENEVQLSPAGMNNTGDIILIRTLLEKDAQSEQLDRQLEGLITKSITPTVTAVAAKYLPSDAAAPIIEGKELVTPTVTNELKTQGVGALIFGSILIMLWIWLRYNIGGFGLRYSVAGIIALAHDLLTLIGMFALLRMFLQVNSPFIAALLTVLGYSIHDTIVIFDRIRENMRLRKGRTFAETVNISLLETMARSVNTILTVLFTLVALLLFGGPTLRDFVAAMLIGVVIGGYSSIFVASQLLVSWSPLKERVILPLAAPIPATAVAGVPAAVAAARPEPTSAAPVAESGVSRDAIQRARQAGKTAKRKR